MSCSSCQILIFISFPEILKTLICQLPLWYLVLSAKYRNSKIMSLLKVTNWTGRRTVYITMQSIQSLLCAYHLRWAWGLWAMRNMPCHFTSPTLHRASVSMLLATWKWSRAGLQVLLYLFELNCYLTTFPIWTKSCWTRIFINVSLPICGLIWSLYATALWCRQEIDCSQYKDFDEGWHYKCDKQPEWNPPDPGRQLILRLHQGCLSESKLNITE